MCYRPNRIHPKKYVPSPTNITLLFLAIFAAVSMAVGIHHSLTGPTPSLDWCYPNALAIRLRYNPYTINMLTESQQQQLVALAPTDALFAPVHFPSNFSLVLPYTYLDWQHAKIAWMISNLFCSCLLLWCLFRFSPHLSQPSKWVISLLFFASTSFRVTLGNGQTGIVATACMLLAIQLAQTKQTAASLAIAIGFLKYHLVALLLTPLVLQKKGKPIAIALVIHAVITLIVSQWVSANPVTLLQQAIAFAFALGLQHGGYIDAPSLLHGVMPTSLIYLIQLTMISVILYLIWQRRNTLQMLEMLSLLSVLSLLVAYHRIYDFILLIMPLTWAIDQMASTKKWSLPSLMTIGLVLSIWFGHKIIALGLPAASEYYRFVVAILGWVTLALLASRLFKPSCPPPQAPTLK